jgi:hypothetical protein
MEESRVRAVASKLCLESMRLVPLQPHVLTYRSSAPLVWRWRCVSCTSAIYLVVCTMGNGGEPGKGGGQQAVFGIHAPSALQPHVLTYRSSAPRVWRWRCVSCSSAIYLVVCTLRHGGEAGEGGGQRAVFGIHAPSAPTTPCAHLWVKRTSGLAVEVCFMYLSNIPCSVYPGAWKRGQ